METAEERFAGAVIEGRTALWERIFQSSQGLMYYHMNKFTRHRDLKEAVAKEDVGYINKLATYEFERLYATGILNNLVIINKQEKILYSASGDGSGNYLAIAKHVLKTKKNFFNMAILDKAPKLFIAFPVYKRGLLCIIILSRSFELPIAKLQESNNSKSFIMDRNGRSFYADNTKFAEKIVRNIDIKNDGGNFAIKNIGDEFYATSLLKLKRF